MIWLAIIAGGLWYTIDQQKKRAAASVVGSKAPENANAPTDPLISDDNTGMPTPTKPPEEIDLSPVKLAPTTANPSVAATAETFTGEPVAMYFEPAAADSRWLDPEAEARAEKDAERNAKKAEREAWTRKRE